MTKVKYQCENCGFYWEKDHVEQFPENCPACFSSRIHRSTKHKRFAKKARIQLRRKYTAKYTAYK